MAYGGHFGFLPTTTYAHTFERDTPPVSFTDLQRRQKTLRNKSSLSTVTEVLQMTQLEIWHGDAHSLPTGDRPLKFRIFENSRWRRPPSWKSQKIAISPQRLHQSLLNLVRQCKMGLLTAPTFKKFVFQSPRWRTAAILKTVKSPYLYNRSTDFDEIWQK